MTLYCLLMNTCRTPGVANTQEIPGIAALRRRAGQELCETSGNATDNRKLHVGTKYTLTRTRHNKPWVKKDKFRGEEPGTGSRVAGVRTWNFGEDSTSVETPQRSGYDAASDRKK